MPRLVNSQFCLPLLALSKEIIGLPQLFGCPPDPGADVPEAISVVAVGIVVGCQQACDVRASDELKEFFHICDVRYPEKQVFADSYVFHFDFVEKAGKCERFYLSIWFRRLRAHIHRGKTRVPLASPFTCFRLHSQHIFRCWTFWKSLALAHWITVARQSIRKPPSSWESGDADFGVRLAVASFLEVAALLAVADDVDFLIAAFLDELRRDFCTLHIRCADRGFFAVVGQKHFVEGNLVSLPCDAVELLNIQNAVLRDNVLLPTRFYDSDFGHMN